MPFRVHLATAVGTGVLLASGLGLALAGPSAAAPATPPAPSATAPGSVVTRPVAPTAVPSSVPATPVQSAPGSGSGIDVPAGGGSMSDHTPGGATSLDIAALIAGGCVLAGGGTVIAIRRRA